MNTSADLKRRLLRLFPVATLKSHFALAAKNQTELLAELIQKNDSEIVQFAFNNIEFTRQHIYLFEHSSPLGGLSRIDVLPSSFVSRHSPNGKIIINYLYEHNYVVNASQQGQYRKLTVKFRQPIRVVFESNIAMVSLTILERNPASYIPEYEVFNYKRTEDDKDVVDKIILEFLQSTNQMLIPLDLNVGIKSLWNSDTIDARALKFKRSNSVVSEKMDENFTFKSKYPDKYAEVIAAPLGKHVFRFLNGTSSYGDFECDPSSGILSFNRYPTTATQISNAISTIIAGNV